MFTFFMSILINIGMWFERFVIIATTLARDYLPSSWSYYSPTWVEIGIFAGTLGIFFTFYLIFVRLAPVVAIAEIKSILKSAGDQYIGDGASHGHGSHQPALASQSVGSGSEHQAEGAVMSAPVAEAVTSGDGDDLTKVEGIGPKIQGLLNAAGIYTYSDLANATEKRLRDILHEAGSRFQMHDPETWAAQAKLAEEGKWDELEKWQDELDGGK